jgi:hypothetical protein
LSDQAEESKSNKGLPDVLAYLSKVWELKWFLRIACVALCADTVLTYFSDAGLLGWKFDLADVTNHAGYVIAALLGICLVMSLALPFLAACVQAALVLSGLASRYIGILDEAARERGFVTLRKLRDHAYATESQFLLNIAKSREQHCQTEVASEKELAALLFGFAVLASVDVVMGLGGHARTLGATIWLSGTWGQVVLGISLLGTCAMLKECWFSTDNAEWVRFPPLAKALLEKEAKEKARTYGVPGAPAFRRRSDQ